MTIALIIPTYKRFDCLKETLNSLALCNTLPDEVIISDQNDHALFYRIENEINRLKNSGLFPNTIWKHLYCEEIGTTASRNKGLEQAKGDIVVFTDDDVIFPKTFFENVHSIMANKKIAMIGGVDYKEFSCKKSNIFKDIFLFFAALKGSIFLKGSVSLGLFGHYPDKFQNMIPTQWAMGYCMIFRRDLLIRSNLLFDTTFKRYGYGEDLELTYLFYKWCKKRHFLTCLSPSIGVYHMVSKENRLNTEQSFFKVFLNRQHINFVIHGGSIIFRFFIFYSNCWYRLINVLHGHGPEIKRAYRAFRPLIKKLNSGVYPSDVDGYL